MPLELAKDKLGGLLRVEATMKVSEGASTNIKRSKKTFNPKLQSMLEATAKKTQVGKMMDQELYEATSVIGQKLLDPDWSGG